MSDRVVEILQAMGLGLSRLIRYAYPGFLLIFIASIVNAPKTGEIIKALTPQVAIITAVIIGAGLYATHRGLIIPVHHFFLCVAFYVYEKIRGIPAEKTVSPTRWLGEIVGVAFGRRILSYRELVILDILDKYEREYPHQNKENDYQRSIRYWDKFASELVEKLQISTDLIEVVLLRIARTGCYEIFQGYGSPSGGKGKTTLLYREIRNVIESY